VFSCGFGWCPAEGYRKRRSVPPYGLIRFGKDFAIIAFVVKAATHTSELVGN